MKISASATCSQSGPHPAHDAAKNKVSAAAAAVPDPHSVRTREHAPPPRGPAHWTHPGPTVPPPSDVRSFEAMIDRVHLTGHVDLTHGQVTMCFTNISPPAYGAPSPVSVPQHPQTLIYPAANPQPGGAPIIRASISASLTHTPTCPLRGWVTGSAMTRVSSSGRREMWFVISYNVYVRNAHGGEAPLQNAQWVVRLQ